MPLLRPPASGRRRGRVSLHGKPLAIEYRRHPLADHYKVLGVSQDASPDEIKRAYRKLARELHPDVAGERGEEEFKDVTRAYEVLSDPRKRQQYDLGVDPTAPSGGGFTGAPGYGNFGGTFGFQDIFETFFGGSMGGGSQGPMPRVRRGQDSLVRLDIDLRDAVFGAEKELQVDTAVTCPICKGDGCSPGTQPRTCTTCEGSGHVQRVARSFLGQVLTNSPCPQCNGYGTIIPSPCPDCRGDGRVREKRTVAVDVPAGVDNGTRIKLSGEGEVGPGGGPHGDLYVEIREGKHEFFKRRGDDLTCKLTVPMTAAALGTVLQVNTFDGLRDLEIRPGTQPGEKIRLKGLGVAKLNQNSRGDLWATVDVQIPTALDDEQRMLLQQFAAVRGEERAQPQLTVKTNSSNSVFGKLKNKLSGK